MYSPNSIHPGPHQIIDPVITEDSQKQAKSSCPNLQQNEPFPSHTSFTSHERSQKNTLHPPPSILPLAPFLHNVPSNHRKEAPHRLREPSCLQHHRPSHDRGCDRSSSQDWRPWVRRNNQLPTPPILPSLSASIGFLVLETRCLKSLRGTGTITWDSLRIAFDAPCAVLAGGKLAAKHQEMGGSELVLSLFPFT